MKIIANKSCINRKKAFTLAEVLVTLMIVGVVASMTIPSVLQSIETTKSRTNAKHSASFLINLFNLIKLDAGGTLNGYFSGESQMVNLIKDKTVNTKICQGTTGCWHPANKWYELNKNARDYTNNYGIILNNGMFISPSWHGYSDCSETTYGTPGGKGTCGHIYIDTNGFTPPNTIGKDIFLFWINEDGILPGGTQGDIFTDPCDPDYPGLSCTAYYLKNN